MSGRSFFSTLMTCKVVDESLPVEKRELPQWKKGNFQYNWIGCLILGVPVFMVLLGIALRVPLSNSTFCMCLVWCAINGIGITAGYHRYYSHKAYNAGNFQKKLFALCGAGAFQGSIKWWARLHRIHHKFVDTDKDPYDARRGFWFTHIGWFCMRMDYDLLGNVDTSDLDAMPIVKYQRDNFAVLAGLGGIILPWLSCILLTGDVWGGLFYGAFLKIHIVHQCSFCINSLAHTSWFWAKQRYSDETTPHDSVVCALVTFGEGYHNFHHEFANDYRNGYRWYHVDPTKWYLHICRAIGLCDGLVSTPDTVIERAMLRLELKNAKSEAKAIALLLNEHDPVVTEVWSEDDVQRLIREDGRKLVMAGGFVLDLQHPVTIHPEDGTKVMWYNAHPGGRALLDSFLGQDITDAINGGVYKHTQGALCIIPELRVAHFKKKTV